MKFDAILSNKTVCAINENNEVVLRHQRSVAFQFAPYEPIIRLLDLKIRENNRHEAEITEEDVLQAIMSHIDKKMGEPNVIRRKR